jgi:F5/8 type C domain
MARARRWFWETKTPFVEGQFSVARLAGIRLQPRQDQSNGWIKDYRVEFGPDGKSWTQAARGTLDRSNREKTVHFPTPVTARYLKLVAEPPFDHQPFASLAELSVIEAEK